MRHKIVTNNGLLPKCATSGLKAFRIVSPQAIICLYSAPEARCTSSPSFFYRHTHPPYFATKTFIPVGPISRYSRTNESWSADGSAQSQTWGVSLDSDSLSKISRSSHGVTSRQRTKIAECRCPNRHPQRGNGLVTPTRRETPPHRTESDVT